MSLPKTWRIVAYNGTGVAFQATDTITINTIRKNVNPTTAIEVYEPTAAAVMAYTGALGIAGYTAGSTMDNVTPGWFEADFEVIVNITTATPSGPVSFYKQFSKDGGSNWPDNGKGEFIGSINFTATGTQKENFSI